MHGTRTTLLWYNIPRGFSCCANLSFFIKSLVKKTSPEPDYRKHIREMAAQLLRCIAFLLLCLFLVSGSSISKKPPVEAIQQNRQPKIENRIRTSSSVLSTTQLDSYPTTIPIVNPTTPATTPPIVNPITSPPPPLVITNPFTSPPPPLVITNPFTSPPPPVAITNPFTSPPPPAAITTPTPTTPASSSGTWCIASPSASETALQVALDYACGYGGADCSAIQQSGSCYNPNTLRDHASYAFNSYYMKNPGPTSCVFGGTAQLTYTDPSSGNCHFVASTGTTTTTPSPSTPTQVTPATPSVTTPPGITIPSGSTDYDGTEPTGTPSSADTMSCNLLFSFVMASFLVSLLTTNYY